MADVERLPGDVEQTVVDILGDLRAGRVDAPVARDIRDAADRRIKQTESEKSFHRAIGRS